MNRRRLSLLAFLLSASVAAHAQDVHYSQYFVAPLSVNPALTGFMDGTLRAMVNYRSQWASVNNAFTTGTLSVDGNILQSKIPANDRLGVGLQVISDKVADGLLTNNYVSASAAYHKGFDKEGNYSLGIGIQGTYSQRSIDAAKLVFNDQLDAYGNFSQTSADAAAKSDGLRRNYWDVAIGGVFKARINEKQQFYIGMSAYHLASPKVTFMSNQQLTVPTRITWNGVYEARLGDMVSISLLGMYSKQEQASEGVFGTILTIGKSWREFDKTPVFYAGMLYRTKDALIPYVAAEYLDIRLGVSYDYNNSSLNAATKGQGGAEISLSYLLRIPPNKKIIYLCPNNPKF
ncbi:MAG: PorP/SprF family type IX secretion system membrane protein [Chitinophagaceae bacterium]